MFHNIIHKIFESEIDQAIEDEIDATIMREYRSKFVKIG